MSDTIYLYLKTHNKTGLKYLGMTTQDPYTYRGSGVYWVRHLEKHGNDVTTEILFETIFMDEFRKVGEYYSKKWNIIENMEFANLAYEQGQGRFGPHSPETIDKIQLSKQNISEQTRSKISESCKGRTPWNKGKASINRGSNNPFFGKSHSEEQKKKWSKARKGFRHSEESKKKISEANQGEKNSFYGKKHSPELLRRIAEASSQKVTCPHCGKVGGKSGMHRWHFDKCRNEER